MLFIDLCHDVVFLVTLNIWGDIPREAVFRKRITLMENGADDQGEDIGDLS
jgi:hypothetical protein